MFMGKFFADRPTLRGFAIIGLIALLVVLLNLYTAVLAIGMLLRIAFFIAIAFFIFLMWRERREDISQWPRRARIVFYGAGLLAVADLGVNWYGGAHGLQVLAFVGILVLSGVAMWRTWRDQHTYS